MATGAIGQFCPYALTGTGCKEDAFPSCVVGALRIDCETTGPCACLAECDEADALGRFVSFCYNTTGALTTVDEMLLSDVVRF